MMNSFLENWKFLLNLTIGPRYIATAVTAFLGAFMMVVGLISCSCEDNTSMNIYILYPLSKPSMHKGNGLWIKQGKWISVHLWPHDAKNLILLQLRKLSKSCLCHIKTKIRNIWNVLHLDLFYIRLDITLTFIIHMTCSFQNRKENDNDIQFLWNVLTKYLFY